MELTDRDMERGSAANDAIASATNAEQALLMAESLTKRVLCAVADLNYVEWQGRRSEIIAREVCRAHGLTV